MGELSRAALDELVAEAVVDAYGDDEQLTALYTMIEDNLAMPFDTTVLGVEVIVRRVDLHTTGSWRSVIGAESGRRSASWIFLYPILRPRALSGLPPIGGGPVDE